MHRIQVPAQSTHLIGKRYLFLQLLATHRWQNYQSYSRSSKIQTYEHKLQSRNFFELSPSFVYGCEKKFSTSRMRRSRPDVPGCDSSILITSISFNNPLSSSTSGVIASEPFRLSDQAGVSGAKVKGQTYHLLLVKVSDVVLSTASESARGRFWAVEILINSQPQIRYITHICASFRQATQLHRHP